jgi:hypothetical protein
MVFLQMVIYEIQFVELTYHTLGLSYEVVWIVTLHYG